MMISLHVPLKQRQPSGSNTGIFVCSRQFLPRLLSALYRGWCPYVRTCATNRYDTQLSFRILQWICSISNISKTHFDDLRHCKDAGWTWSCLTINHFLVPPTHSRKSGMQISAPMDGINFPRLCKSENIRFIYTDGLWVSSMLILQYKRQQQFRTPSAVQLTQPASINMNAKILIVALCAFQVRQHTAFIDVA